MRAIEIDGTTGKSIVFVGQNAQKIKDYFRHRDVVFVTDSNVFDLYSDLFANYPLIILGTSELIKNLNTINAIYEKFIEFNVDRSWLVVAVGGGIVCDITGFAASTYMRGVSVGYIASTLLAQVDASVGGKTGVNLKGYKNLVGVFNQPEFVVCDPNLLKTLPLVELQCGFAEVIKHSIIGEKGLFGYLVSHYQKALDLNRDCLEEIIYRSVSIKAEIVRQDEKETGLRRILNFGHTFGHAFEKVSGLPHGQAISIGMVIATSLSVSKGLLSPEIGDEIVDLLKKFDLPTSIDCNGQKVMDALLRDKKRSGDLCHCILLNNIGEPIIKSISFSELGDIVQSIQKYCVE